MMKLPKSVEVAIVEMVEEPMLIWSNQEVEDAAREMVPEVGFLNQMGVVVELKFTAKLVAGVKGKANVDAPSDAAEIQFPPMA